MTHNSLDFVNFPHSWSTAPFWSVAPRVKEVNHPNLPPLSVYLDAGVIPRNLRSDNHNQLGEDLTKYLAVKPGDLVFNKLRTWQGGLGMSEYRGIVSPAYYVCRPTSTANPRFLHYLLRSTPYLTELRRRSKWMPPSQFDIPWESLRDLPITLPDQHHQRRIADFLDAETTRIDRFIYANHRFLERLAERRTTAIIDEVSGERHLQQRQSTLAWLRHIPGSWDEVRVGLLARMGSGHTPSRSRPDWWQECTIPWITTGEVQQVRDDRAEEIFETREKISEVGLRNSAAELHPKGTVALCRTASAGYSAVMGVDMATSQDFVTWTCGPRLDPFYLLWCLRAMRQDLLGRLAMGSTHKTIYVPDLQALRIPLPPTREEQAEIVRRIRKNNERVDRLMDRVRRQSNLLAERRQALITAAVTGQFDVSTASGRGVTE